MDDSESTFDNRSASVMLVLEGGGWVAASCDLKLAPRLQQLHCEGNPRGAV